MQATPRYHIGTPGCRWSNDEKQQWQSEQTIKRSYAQQVCTEVDALAAEFEVVEYGLLDYSPNTYALRLLKTKDWQAGRPNVLITGGVHGYETSGVHGALRFAQQQAQHYQDKYNFIIAPCVSPWGYETINRWNPHAIDPNRSFYNESPSQEAAYLMSYLAAQSVSFITHIDLHETTDTDNSEFRPALLARDALPFKYSEIPDGFYLVGDSTKAQPAFQKAIIDAVRQVTHIAPADEQQCLIGVPISQVGVVNYAARELGLCMGLTDAPYVTTTEVYPDSERVDDDNCCDAQVSVICAALNYLDVVS